MSKIQRRRCMVCAKEFEMVGSVCEACHAKIRGEATGKQESLRKESEKEIERAGISPETHKPEKDK